jgi:hypothetical protein
LIWGVGTWLMASNCIGVCQLRTARPVADITFITLGAQHVPVTVTRRVVHHVGMAVPTIALPAARNALSSAAGRWADLLRSLPDTRATIPGSSWTVGDAAAHVVLDVRTEALVAAGEAVSWAEGATSAPGTPRGAAEQGARPPRRR